MTLFQRIKFFFTKHIKKATGVTKIEELEFALQKKKKDFKEMKNSFDELRAELQVTQTEITESTNRKNKLKEIALKLNKASKGGENKDKELEECFLHIKRVESRIALLEKQEVDFSKMVEVLGNKTQLAENVICRLQVIVETEKGKAKFVETSKKYISVIDKSFSDGDTTSVEDLCRGIEVEYGTANIKMEELKDFDSTEALEKDFDFKAWKDSL